MHKPFFFFFLLTAVKVSTAQGLSTISTDTAQLLLNLSGADNTLQQQSVNPTETQPVQVITSRGATTSTQVHFWVPLMIQWS